MASIIPQSETQAQANIDALFAFAENTNCAPEPESAVPSPVIDIATEKGKDSLCELPIGLLIDFPQEKHPFRPYTAEELERLVEDVRLHGVLQPALVRPHPTRPGYYEIIAGHNRRTAAQTLGYTTLPCIVREMDDDEALLQMISTNLQQREKLLPSEKAWAYRYEIETLNRQGIRRDLTSPQAAAKLRSDDEIGEQSGVSGDTIQRYIRLTYLLPSLLELVDNRKLPLTVGEVLSHIPVPGQQVVENFFFLQRSLPITQSMAERCRELAERGELSEQTLEMVFLIPPSIKNLSSVKIKLKKWKKYFGAEATQEQVIDTIEAALKEYFERKRSESG